MALIRERAAIATLSTVLTHAVSNYYNRMSPGTEEHSVISDNVVPVNKCCLLHVVPDFVVRSGLGASMNHWEDSDIYLSTTRLGTVV